MKKNLYRILIPLLFICIVMVISCSDDSNINDPDDGITTELTAIMDSVIANTHVPGLVAGVWAPDKNLSFVYTAGTADRDTITPMDEEMTFRIGSNTKTITITVFLQLVDEGILALDEYLANYLPLFPRSDEVTLEMLTNMRSGIYNYSESEYFQEMAFTHPTHFWMTDSLIAIAAAEPYYFDPGTDFHYSNSNTIIIGKIIEMVTGNSLESEIQNRIFDELGLINTEYLIGGIALPGYHSKAYYMGLYDLSVPELSEYIDVSWAAAAGSAVSTLFELKTYARALTNGNFLSDSLQQHRINGHPLAGSDFTYGMGIFSYQDFYGHNGGMPGYTSLMMHSSVRNCTIIIWFNCQLDELTPTELLPSVVKAVYPDLQ